jgi:hypothetical protein
MFRRILLGRGTTDSALYYGALMDRIAQELEQLLTQTVGNEIPEGLSKRRAHVIGFHPTRSCVARRRARTTSW